MGLLWTLFCPAQRTCCKTKHGVGTTFCHGNGGGIGMFRSGARSTRAGVLGVWCLGGRWWVGEEGRA